MTKTLATCRSADDTTLSPFAGNHIYCSGGSCTSSINVPIAKQTGSSKRSCALQLNRDAWASQSPAQTSRSSGKLYPPRIRGVPGSSVGPQADYPDYGISCFRQPFQENVSDNASDPARSASLHILSMHQAVSVFYSGGVRFVPSLGQRMRRQRDFLGYPKFLEANVG
jgi:hypothetical protein